MFRTIAGLFVTFLLATGCGQSDGQKTGTPVGGGAASGTGGASGGSSGQNSGAGGLLLGTGGDPAPTCKNTGEACADSTECCTGNTCNNTAGSAELNGCRLRCTQNSDCQTGCCVLFTNDPTKGICGDAKWCSCGTPGTACSSQLPPCCTDSVCLAADQAQTSYACRKKCTAPADCPGGCCVSIPGLGGQSACLGPEYCPAAP